MRARPSLVAFGILLAACGGTTAPPASRPTAPPAAGPEPPASPVAFVQLLVDTAAGRRPGSLTAHVDADFGRQLRSAPLDATLAVPPGCAITLEAGAGYGAVAVPPPSDRDPPDVAARQEALIARLQASTEVTATCPMAADEGEEKRVETTVIFAISIERGRDGRWRALAWRRIHGERTH